MSQSFTSMDARTRPQIIKCTNGVGLYEIDTTHETFDTYEEALKALNENVLEELRALDEYINNSTRTQIDFTESELNVIRSLLHEERTDMQGNIFHKINASTIKSLKKKLKDV